VTIVTSTFGNMGNYQWCVYIILLCLVILVLQLLYCCTRICLMFLSS